MNKTNIIKYSIIILLVASFSIGCSVKEVRDGTEDNMDSISQISMLEGEGTQDNPYYIETIEDLQQFSKEVNQGRTFEGQYVILKDDLDMQEVEKFSPIGEDENAAYFSGTFDGNGFGILNIKVKEKEKAGIFTNLNGNVYNLRIEGELEGDTCGGIAAIAAEGSNIINCESYAVITGKEVGGIAGISYGTIINCVNHLEENTGKIVSDTDECTIWNCYTQESGCFELQNNTSQEADHKNRQNAVNNLNKMIGELKMKDPTVKWIKWKLSDENNPVLSGTIANVIVEAVVIDSDGNEQEGEYDQQLHAWKLGSLAQGENKIVLKLDDGSEKIIACHDGISELIETYGDITYRLVFDYYSDEYDQKILPGVIQEITKLDFHKESVIPLEHETTKVEIQKLIYRNDDYNTLYENKRVIIKQPGTYEITGELNGQIRVDLGTNALADGNAQVVLRLSDLKLTNHYGPGIQVVNVLETGTTDMPGIRIELVDGTENSICASNYMNIFSKKQKSEGAVSSEETIGFYGVNGILQIIGDLEGIESKYSVIFDGGKYDIQAPDDTISTSNDVDFKEGEFLLTAGDDAVDCNDTIHVWGGNIKAYSENEHIFNGIPSIKGGFIAGISSYENGGGENSVQNILEVSSSIDNYFRKGEVLSVIDENNTEIYKLPIEIDGNHFYFSIPQIEGKNIKIKRITQKNAADGYLIQQQDGSVEFMVTEIYNHYQVQ